MKRGPTGQPIVTIELEEDQAEWLARTLRVGHIRSVAELGDSRRAREVAESLDGEEFTEEAVRAVWKQDRDMAGNIGTILAAAIRKTGGRRASPAG